MAAKSKTTSTRPRIPFQPRWEPEIKGYALRTVATWYPRLKKAHEFSDLMQEAWIVFALCSRCYQGKVDNPRWFMALYKTSLLNRMKTIRDGAPRYSLEEVPESDQLTVPDDSMIAAAVRELPKELLEVLALCALGLGGRTTMQSRRELQSFLQGLAT